MSTVTIPDSPRGNQSPSMPKRLLSVHRSFIIKELRQSAFVLLIGTAATVLGLTALIGAPTSIMPLVTGEATLGAAWIAVTFSVALGLSQAIEFNRRSSIFLMHMPISRQQLVWAKLMLGGVLLLVVFVSSILIASFAFALPHRTAPFYWSMSLDLWRVVLTSTMVYLTAFLCGVRPASWFGTRLLPIVGICVFAFAIQLIPFWWLITPVLILFVDWLLITTIMYFAETRDYA